MLSSQGSKGPLIWSSWAATQDRFAFDGGHGTYTQLDYGFMLEKCSSLTSAHAAVKLHVHQNKYGLHLNS